MISVLGKKKECRLKVKVNLEKYVRLNENGRDK